jgi:DNA-binding transcriptional LysR family regulator
MRNIDSNLAKIFVSIAEEGSIAKAARRENIVSSAVSKRLSELEAFLGVSLVERGRRGVKLTSAGETLLYHARLVLQAIDRMHAEMSEYVKGVRGRITLRVSASSLLAGLPADLQEFVALNKQILLDIEECETPLIIRDIAESRADLGIAPNIFGNALLQYIPYKNKSYDLAVAMAPQHPLAKLKEVAYLQTLRYDYVEQNRGTAISQMLDYAEKQSSSTRHTRIRVRGWEAVCRMISCRMGIGIVPSLLEVSYGALYHLKFVPLTDDWAHQRICIIARNFEGLPSAAKALVNHLR